MNNIASLSFVIADDHYLFRQGLAELILSNEELVLAGQASNGEEVVELARKFQPDIIFMDIQLTKLNGVEATNIIIREFPAISIIALTMFDDDQTIIDMLNAGARGFLSKNIHRQDIFSAIEAMAQGKTFYCKKTSQSLARLITTGRYREGQFFVPVFDDTELLVIKGICKQWTTKEISRKLFLSPRTVDGYRRRIMSKMEVKTLVGIAIYAVKKGIYPE